MGYGFWTTTGAPRAAGAETWLAGSFANGVEAWAGGGWTGEEFAGAWLEGGSGLAGGYLPLHRTFSLGVEGTGAVSPYYDAADPRTGRSLSLSGSLSWRPLDRWTWSGSAGLERFTELDGAVLYAGTVLRLRTDFFFTPRLWARGIGDASTFDASGRVTALVAWERGPGTALWLGGAWDRAGEVDGWQAFAKASWAIGL